VEDHRAERGERVEQLPGGLALTRQQLVHTSSAVWLAGHH
jgi:hypothetical protein